MWMSAFSGRLRNVISWHVRTQIGARRNALVGLTELTERCREHGEVTEFLERLAEPEAEPMTGGARAALPGGSRFSAQAIGARSRHRWRSAP